MMDFRRRKAGQYVARYTTRFSIYRNEMGTWGAFDAEQTEDEGLVGEYGTLDGAKTALSRIQTAERRELSAKLDAEQAERRAAAKAKEEADREERLASSPNLRNHGVFAQVTITRKEALALIKELADDAEDDTVTLFIRSSEVYVPASEPGRRERLDISVGSGGWNVARAEIVDSMIVPEMAEAKTA